MTYDVIVAGGGPAGFAAAVNAARTGARTLIIEAQGDVGGVATTGMMSHFTGSVNSMFYDELLERSAARMGVPKTVTIDPEQLKTLMADMLEEAGADILLYTLVCGALTHNGRVTGVKTQSKSGSAEFSAKIVIDATGDGDVAYLAGAAYDMGRESDGKTQPVTLMFKLGGVDESRCVLPGSFETTVDTPKGELQALARARLAPPAGHVLLYRSTLPGVVTVNMTNQTGINGTRAEELTKAHIACRRQLNQIVEFLRAYAPGYENCYLLSSASVLGVRETRRVRGVQTLTERDILAAREREDWAVKRARFNFDVHNISGAGLDATGAQKHFPQQNGYDIPYGCLVPEQVDGLIVAGRCISGTHLAHSNYRVMPICVAMGEAAGVAAALCAQKGVEPRALDAREIQKYLRGSGE